MPLRFYRIKLFLRLILSGLLLCHMTAYAQDQDAADIPAATQEKNALNMQQARLQTEMEPENIAAWQNLGRAADASGDAGTAETAYLQALQLAIKHNDKVVQAMQYTLLGRLYAGHKEYDKMLDVNQKALPVYQLLGQQDSMLTTYSAMAQIAAQKGEIDKLKEYAFASLHIYEQMNNKQGMAQIYLKLGDLYYQSKDVDKALDMLQRAAQNYENIGYQDGMAKAYLNLGLLYLTRADLYQADETYQKAVKIYEQSGNKKAQAEVYALIANLYTSLNVPDKVLAMYQKALQLQHELGNQKAEAQINREQANVYLKQKNFDQAEQLLQNALQIEQNIDDKPGISASYTSLGLLEANRGALDKAQSNCETASQMTDESMPLNKLLMAPIYSCLGMVNRAKGDNAQALKYFQQSLDLYKSQNPPRQMEIQALEKTIATLTPAPVQQ